MKIFKIFKKVSATGKILLWFLGGWRILCFVSEQYSSLFIVSTSVSTLSKIVAVDLKNAK